MAKVAKEKQVTSGSSAFSFLHPSIPFAAFPPTNPPFSPVKPNSRSSRRATSPHLNGNISPSLLTHPRPSPPPSKPLRPLHTTNAGITKSRKAKAKPLSRQQRLRREKGIERAEAFGDRVSKKVDRSKEKGGVRRERRRGWEDVNVDVEGPFWKKRRRVLKVDGEKDGKVNGGGDVDGWEDVVDGKGEKVEVESGRGTSDEEQEGEEDIDRNIRMARVAVHVTDGVGLNGVGMGEPGVQEAGVEDEEL